MLIKIFFLPAAKDNDCGSSCACVFNCRIYIIITLYFIAFHPGKEGRLYPNVCRENVKNLDNV